jgi:hypothetical protein
MNNINSPVSGRISRTRGGLVSVLILAAITSGLGTGIAIPSVAYAQEGPTLNCANSGGNGGAGGDSGASNAGDGGTTTAGDGGSENGNGGDNNGGDGGSRNGNGGDARGGNGGDASSEGGHGGDGGRVRQTCVLVSKVVNVNPTIEVPSVELEPVAEHIVARITERVS